MSSSPDSNYQVVARRFRPQTFQDVVGQANVVTSLRGILSSGKVPHAFLFCGSRGVGKTTSARILARALNCEKGVSPDPCGMCHQCTTILEGRNPDVIEIDAASHNLVDDIRDLRDRVGFASMGARTKVYILDEVHMLTRSAFNAFLKTLEEPPPNVVFVLATTELHKVPDTIRSRCFTLEYRRIAESDIQGRLRSIVDSEGVEVEDGVLEDLARACNGGMRDAETALERILSLARERGGALDLETYRRLEQRVGRDRAVEVSGALLAGDARPALHFAQEVASSGVDEREALGELLEALRHILLLKLDGPETALVEAQGPLRDRMIELGQSRSERALDGAMQACLLGRERLRRTEDRRAVLELSLLRVAQASELPTLESLVASIASGVSIEPAGGATGESEGAIAPMKPSGIRGAFLAGVKQRKPQLFSTAEQCEVDGPDDSGIVRIRCVSTRRLHIDRLAAPENRELLAEALREAAGKDIQIQWHEAAQGMDDAPAHQPEGELPDAVERVRKRFDGTMVDPRELDR
ncbi:MAG: DNA polymerase III subunit gamma/tau [Planctomycetota bacterium]